MSLGNFIHPLKVLVSTPWNQWRPCQRPHIVGGPKYANVNAVVGAQVFVRTHCKKWPLWHSVAIGWVCKTGRWRSDQISSSTPQGGGIAMWDVSRSYPWFPHYTFEIEFGWGWADGITPTCSMGRRTSCWIVAIVRRGWNEDPETSSGFQDCWTIVSDKRCINSACPQNALHGIVWESSSWSISVQTDQWRWQGWLFFPRTAWGGNSSGTTNECTIEHPQCRWRWEWILWWRHSWCIRPVTIRKHWCQPCSSHTRPILGMPIWWLLHLPPRINHCCWTTWAEHTRHTTWGPVQSVRRGFCHDPIWD